MTVTNKIEASIRQIANGEVFTINQLKLENGEYQAAVKALGRMTKIGAVKRSMPGKYYKPEKTTFGDLKPGEEQLLKLYLFNNGKRIAYITGTSLYNKMGLTTQVPATIKIASYDKRVNTKVGAVDVKPAKSYVEVREANFRLLEILDAIKDFRKIPDLDRGAGLKRLKQLIKTLCNDDIDKLLKISLKYPPRVRALTGALLENIGFKMERLKILRSTLNPLSVYCFGITKAELPELETWNIL